MSKLSFDEAAKNVSYVVDDALNGWGIGENDFAKIRQGNSEEKPSS